MKNTSKNYRKAVGYPCVVSTKEELKTAIKRKEPDILVVGSLAEKIKPLAKLQKLSPVKLGLLIATASAAFIIPGGKTVASGTIVVQHLMAPTLAAKAGVSTGAALALISLLGILGLSAFALAKGYNIDLAIKHGAIHLKAKK